VKFLSLPFRGLIWVFDEIATQAEHALHDEDSLRHSLAELYRELEAGTLDEETFTAREAELAQRLVEAERYWRRREGH
jgi:cytochrome c-type biogenesis protein CcmH/NrfG